MNIPKEKREALGIGFDGADVPETEIFKALEAQAAKVEELTQSTEATAVADLTKRAEAGDKLVDAMRTEVTRLAKIAELGAEGKGELDEVVQAQIAGADADGLIKLETYFGKRVAEKFPKGGRSSLENSDEIDEAGGVETVEDADLPTVGLL